LIDYDIMDGDLNFMQQGLTSADFINTVSPSYAQEILEGKYPIEISDIIKSREGRFSGILNGLDYAQFPRNFDISNWKSLRPEGKKMLKEKLGFKSGQDKPIFTFIGRLDPNQKGIDILHEVVPYIVEKGGQFVLLGSGNPEWEQKYAELGNLPLIKDNVSINLKLDLELANLLYSGSDFLVVPSKYEPCGLIQMIAMWFGSLPIVNNTGGLKDTIIDGETGFIFNEYSSSSLRETIDRAMQTYSTSKMDDMIVNALQADFSWDRSAVEYKKLYGHVLKLRLDSKFEEAF
jgi:starch synthase